MPFANATNPRKFHRDNFGETKTGGRLPKLNNGVTARRDGHFQPTIPTVAACLAEWLAGSVKGKAEAVASFVAESQKSVR